MQTAQLAFKTSSSKKRKLSRPLSEQDPSPGSSPSSDSVLPSCEPDDDPALSFSGASVAFGPDSPPYGRASSQPFSGPTPRLPLQASSLLGAGADSAASSPCATAYAGLSLDNEQRRDEAGPALNPARSQSPFSVSRRAIMSGDADLPHRSSSPLKRRASSMDPETNAAKDTDVEMGTSQQSDASNDAADAMPREMSIDVPESEGTAVASEDAPVPPLLEQVKIIKTLLDAFAETPIKENDSAYIVSRAWVDKALALHSDPKQAKTDPSDITLGPVDNSDIIEEVIKEEDEQFVRLKPGTGLEDFEIFPEDAWGLVMAWHGLKEGQLPIVRMAFDSSMDIQSEPNIAYEFHPPVFRIHRVWSQLSPIAIDQSLKASNPPPVILVRSRKCRVQAFIKDIKGRAGIPPDRRIRFWAIPRQLPGGGGPKPRSALTPPDSPNRAENELNPQDSWSTLLLDVVNFAQVSEQRISLPIPDHTANPNYNGSSTLQHQNLSVDQTLVVEEAINNNEWVSTYSGPHRNSPKSMPTRGNAAASSKLDSGRASPALSGPVTRGREQKKRSLRTVGSVGLHNLGNTCYMNSALQCVRSVEELTKYFLTEAYIKEINKGNKLGHNGKIALAYGSLLTEVYAEGRGAVSPRDFKNTVGRCRSTFSGWGQQDSHEFLAFLLDALQEDLNRIKEKPYIEKPDSTDDMINNPEAIREMADKVWDITRRRDDSIIADLFTGMYKSTLKCPECGKISITFDPFNNLTLQLPVEDLWSTTIKFFPLNDAPVKMEVEMPKHRTIEALKQFVSAKTGVPVNRLMGAEEFKDKFFKIYEDNQDASEEIQPNDVCTIHELEAAPTNWPNKAYQKKYRSMLDIDSPPESEWDDPRYERMVIPVLHRRASGFDRNADGISPPHFIVLTKEEASNYDIIRRKVLEKVATFSTWSKLTESSTESSDAEMVMASTSDADSSGESKVAANSVEGEEDMVDVTMKDVGDTNPQQSAGDASQVLRRFNTQRPKFVDPEAYLPAELQGLFELAYFSEGQSGHVPSGWSQVENPNLPKLSDRIPERSTEDEDAETPESWDGIASGNEESSNEDESKAGPNQTRMAEESSEEDIPTSMKMNARAQQNGGRKKLKGHKYVKKGNKRRDKQMRNSKHAQRIQAVKPQPMPPAVADGGPLVRLGEGLVVEWNEDAWMAVYGGNARNPNPDQGSRTFVNLETLEDQALKINQRKRKSRRSKGLTLEECLDEFERAEVLSEHDMWYCPRCKEHRQASKKLNLWKTPDILVVHLKRFSSSGWRRDKLDVHVEFPIEALDLTARVIQKEDGKDEIYDLIAVDDHYGGLGGGHYTAYAKNFVDGKWYDYNDSHVTPVSDPSSTVTSAAYLLFYRRRSKGPLGGPRFVEIFEQYDKVDDDDAPESGEDQRLDGGSSLNGSSSAGTGAAAAHPQLGRGSASTKTTCSGAEDEELPSYSVTVREESIQHSIEDEGVDMTDGAKPLSLAQGWSFDTLPLDSSADEREREGSFPHQDTAMTIGDAHEGGEQHEVPPAPDDNAQIALSDIQNAAWERSGIISVPAAAGSDRDSDVVAEIHLEGSKPHAE
ncbi:hypothetical protein B0I35DRAFT_456639 [Stachybotrys elegans]|uniref:ubiquitinyl hydrolase 1 n=1 Tax=Stachybotrys elegans TaxID=80388 RepID=A0A8K0WY76_9HYPO|nr:hypothetical protein B0I35DRAFT_456639 [Stachybotrys elegans]